MDFLETQVVIDQALGHFNDTQIEDAGLTEGELESFYDQAKSFSECYAREGGELLAADFVETYTAFRVGGMQPGEAEAHLGSAMDQFASTQDGCYVRPSEQAAELTTPEDPDQGVKVQETPTAPGMGM